MFGAQVKGRGTSGEATPPQDLFSYFVPSCRQGEEWYRHRRVVSRKTLRPRDVQEYCAEMSAVAADFTRHLRRVSEPHAGVVPELHHQLFKWALECEFTHNLLLPASFVNLFCLEW